MKLGILILHYNTPEITEALCRMTGSKTIVIDNGSDHDKRYRGKHECIKFDRNWGFTLGWNMALKKVYDRFDAFWLMNSDIVITQKSIDRIHRLLIDNSDIGMITPNYNCWIKYCNNLGTGSIRQVKCLELTAPVIRKSVFEKIGFFDERFSRGYGVDFDFAIRMRNAGLKIFVDDESSFFHKQHQTILLHEGINEYNQLAIRELENGMYDKYGPAWRAIVKNNLKLDLELKVKIAVYTTIFGDYAPLRSVPKQSKEADYFCITDNSMTKAEGWNIICPGIPRADLHPRLRAKFFKMFPWECEDLRRYEILIFINGSIEITSPDFVKYCIDNMKSDILLFKHPERDCIYDEVKASVGLIKYQKENLQLQENVYRSFHPKKYGLYACGIMVMKITEKIKALMSAWWWENIKYTWQDQISFPVVCKLLEIVPSVFPDKQYPNQHFRIHWHDDQALEKNKSYNYAKNPTYCSSTERI